MIASAQPILGSGAGTLPLIIVLYSYIHIDTREWLPQADADSWHLDW